MPDTYWRAKEIFIDAVDLSDAERDGFVIAACGGDDQLLSDVRSLLTAHDRADSPTRTTAPPRPFRIDHESPGTVIGAYTLIELIGQGGMGVVHKAQQRTPIHRIVALKLIKLGMDTRQVIARFESERQALAMMSHPNVAAVYDAGATETGRPYFVMEFVPGKPITQFCDEHKYNTRQRLGLFLQACEAIQHAHQKAIIHRDLKPGNILVTLESDKPQVKVIDFGVAKATQQKLTEQTLYTESGQLVGTPEYMSPEQAELSAADVDTRTDIYSLGVALYELLVGALPFDSKSFRAATYAQIQAFIRDSDPPRPSTRVLQRAAVEADRSVAQAARTLARELRGELEWIPLKAMRKERSQRYQTAAEFAQDIRNFLDGKPLLAGPETTAYRAKKFLRRNKVPVIAAAAVLVTLVAGIIGTTIGLIGQSRQRKLAEEQAAIADAVSKFQSDMLASADPTRMLGDKVTVLQAVTAAVKELDGGKLKDQPLVEASVRDTIGSTLMNLGRSDAAEPNFRRSVELRRGVLAANDSKIASAVGNLGLALQGAGKLAEAEPALREAVAIERANTNAPNNRLAVALNNLALLLDAQGRFADAEGIYRESLAMRRSVFGDDDARTARTRNNLAACLYAQGKLLEAEPLHRESLEIARKRLPAMHPDLAPQLNNLAMLLRAEGKYQEAESLCREALEINRKSLPAVHPDTAKALVNLAFVLREEQKLDDAEKLLREAVEMNKAALPPGHADSATTMLHLGYLMQDRGNVTEAERIYRDALEIFRKALPKNHPQVATCLVNLASLVRDQNRPAEAEPLFREAISAFSASAGKNHWKTGQAHAGLGRTLASMQRWSQAETELLQAEQILAAAKGIPPDRHEKAVAALREFYAAWDKAEPNAGHDQQAARWK